MALFGPTGACTDSKISRWSSRHALDLVQTSSSAVRIISERVRRSLSQSHAEMPGLVAMVEVAYLEILSLSYDSSLALIIHRY
jgi:hypothetical protein